MLLWHISIIAVTAALVNAVGEKFEFFFFLFY